MKNQALFSLKDKSKKIKMLSAAIFVWRFKGSVPTEVHTWCCNTNLNSKSSQLITVKAICNLE